jgi:hypothetical protein
VEFWPDAHDRALLEAKEAATWKSSQARGAAPWIGGWPARREAYVAAIRLAIEAWARSVEPVRPSRIRGRVLLDAVPQVAIVDQAYAVTARVRIEVGELARWEFW